MAPSQTSAGRAAVIAAVKAPIALFALALLVIEVMLGGLGVSRSLGSLGSTILASGMIASLLITLFGFLFALFYRPEVLFVRGPREEAIAAFRRLGDHLTANDIKILTNMLGSGANFFSWFCESVGQTQDARSLSKRQAKLEKLNFIEKVGSEVQLTMLGTSYVQVVARFGVPPTTSAEKILNPATLVAVAREFDALGADEDIEIIRPLSTTLHVERAISADSLRSILIKKKFDIVHVLAVVDKDTGNISMDGGGLSADGFVTLCRQTGAKLVVLATCDSLALAAKLSPAANVIAASGWVETEHFHRWARTFFEMLVQGNALSQASETARSSSEVPMILLLKRDIVFTLSASLTEATGAPSGAVIRPAMAASSKPTSRGM